MPPFRLFLGLFVSALVAASAAAQAPSTAAQEPATPTKASPAPKKAAAAPATKEPTFWAKLAAPLQPTRTVVYKKVGDRELRLDVFMPANAKPTDRRAALINFHGGGWSGGAPRVMYPFADYAAQHGLVGISVQYRLYKPGTENTVFVCVQDGRSAMRYVRTHAAEFGIDPAHLIACGSSAGGHLAAATGLFDDINEPGEDLTVSARPEAMILLWPVSDTSTEGYGNAKIGERWRELSPLHRVRAGLPPTILFHGTADATVPFKGAEAFHEAMLKAGNRCDFIVGPGGGHGFVTQGPEKYATGIAQIQAFLESVKILPAR